jgi:16S rRNA U516 pseudouridylate synthase RsuA-like enzyme
MGRNRVVRRMVAHVIGTRAHLIALHRERIGPLSLREVGLCDTRTFCRLSEAMVAELWGTKTRPTLQESNDHESALN